MRAPAIAADGVATGSSNVSASRHLSCASRPTPRRRVASAASGQALRRRGAPGARGGRGARRARGGRARAAARRAAPAGHPPASPSARGSRPRAHDRRGPDASLRGRAPSIPRPGRGTSSGALRSRAGRAHRLPSRTHARRFERGGMVRVVPAHRALGQPQRSEDERDRRRQTENDRRAAHRGEGVSSGATHRRRRAPERRRRREASRRRPRDPGSGG